MQRVFISNEMKTPIYVIKASGERERWDRRKLERSLRAASAGDDLAREIIGHVEKDVEDGMRTRDIYAHAFRLLKRYDRPIAAQYGLREAIMQLGPSGFPFERFVAKILDGQGYETRVGVVVRGACVDHEIDVVAEKDDERILVEAKFHNQPHTKSDVKVALYVHARFEDIQKRVEGDKKDERFTHAWLITNTHFTSQAIQYGACAGLAMTGWNSPKGRTLQDLIRATQTHPVTCLTTLRGNDKNFLLEEGIVLCRDIVRDATPLRKLGMSQSRIRAVQNEGERLCAT